MDHFSPSYISERGKQWASIQKPTKNNVLTFLFSYFPLSGGINMKYELLSESEMENQVSGEALTLTAVMAVLATAIIAVIVYKLFLSDKGNATVPGGWKFSWN